MGTIENLTGETLLIDDISNTYAELYDISYVSENQNIVVEACALESVEESAFVEGSTATVDYIEDPYDYSDENYTGPFVLDEWNNPYETYVAFYEMNLFTTYGYLEHCGPTAIVNLMQIIGSAYGENNLLASSTSDLVTRFHAIAQLKNSGGDNYFRNGSGVYFYEFDEYLVDAFALYGETITSTNISGITYANVKAQIDAGHPLALGVVDHEIYGRHFVTAYAYCRLVSETTGFYKSFVKIVDGHNSSGRYLDIATIEDPDFNYMYTVIPNAS